jgi:tellurite resistance protein TehA-like permease
MSITPSVEFTPLAARPHSQHTLAPTEPAIAMEKPTARQHDDEKPLGWLEHACLNLSPAFFSLNMGTGIASVLLHNLPYNADWLRSIAIVIFILNIIIFVLLSIGTLVRFVRWRGIFTALGRHTLAGMYWGCLPMGMVTIIVSKQLDDLTADADGQNMIALVCVPAWGHKWALLAVGLWWINIIMAVFTNIGMIFMM